MIEIDSQSPDDIGTVRLLAAARHLLEIVRDRQVNAEGVGWDGEPAGTTKHYDVCDSAVSATIRAMAEMTKNI